MARDHHEVARVERRYESLDFDDSEIHGYIVDVNPPSGVSVVPVM